MIVHGYFRSSAAYRLRIALNLKRLGYEFRPVHLRKGDQSSDAYKALNPQGLVPALDTDEGAVLTQSLAIIEWLDETHPEPALLPKDPVTRAHARAFALAIACEIHPLQNLRVLRYLRTEFAQEQDGQAAGVALVQEGGHAADAGLPEGRQEGKIHGGSPGWRRGRVPTPILAREPSPRHKIAKPLLIGDY